MNKQTINKTNKQQANNQSINQPTHQRKEKGRGEQENKQAN